MQFGTFPAQGRIGHLDGPCPLGKISVGGGGGSIRCEILHYCGRKSGPTNDYRPPHVPIRAG
ncbi:MAG: hypothetical protein LAP21_09360 [Acidobacteriia bacterium]|nr:hypothetical protein [Terriglobia bacterium]